MKIMTLLVLCSSLFILGCVALQKTPQPVGSTNAPTYEVRQNVATALSDAQTVLAAFPPNPWTGSGLLLVQGINSLLAGLAAWKSHAVANSLQASLAKPLDKPPAGP